MYSKQYLEVGHLGVGGQTPSLVQMISLKCAAYSKQVPEATSQPMKYLLDTATASDVRGTCGKKDEEGIR